MSRADTQEDLNAVIRQHSEVLAAQLHSQRESLFPPDASKSMRKFTSGEAAALLGVNDSYLRKLHLDGKGPSPEVSSGNGGTTLLKISITYEFCWRKRLESQEITCPVVAPVTIFRSSA